MIKKISISDLTPGMYVEDLNCDWKPHNEFNRKQGLIKKESIVERIREIGITEVYIDSKKGLDVNHAEAIEDVSKEMDKKLQKVAEESFPQEDQISVASEMRKAAKLHKEAKNLVDNVMSDVKLGKNIEVENIEILSQEIINSVFRNKDALSALGRIRHKDKYLLEHSVNLSVLMTVFGKSYGISKETLQQISIGALLHDIGKILIPESILHKPGKLTAKEILVMKKHVEYSRQLLLDTPDINELSIQVASQHHERLDGNGYPDGLKGEEISLYGRMVSIVDVYDAITSDRVYHKGMAPATAFKKLIEWSGDHLDGALVHKFIKCMGIYPVGSLVELKSGRVGIVLEQHEKSHLLPKVRLIYNVKHHHYIKVQDIDLSKPSMQDEIVKPIVADKYNLQVSKFM
ncbi:MAG: HD-GYP domain-containing protein [Pseudomonadota bacterium]